nr:maleylpyruvate isomerase family mycothiol-dependent enzyme [Pseudonocardia acidicola]
MRGLMSRLGDEAFAAPSALPGWSRAHVLTHIARNADAMINLLTWARTGVVTPAYVSREQRDADIEAGAGRPADAIRTDVEVTSDKLAQVVKAMPESAWSATVRNVQGVEIPATDIPWVRAREMWIHAVDLDAGAAFTDFPAPMVHELLTDVTATLGAKEDCPAVRLIATDHQQVWTLRTAAGAVAVLGPAAELAGWVLGRTRSRELRTDDGRPLPELPGWL